MLFPTFFWFLLISEKKIMGNSIGKAMNENLEKQQAFMMELNQITVERQIQMQNQMRERMAATQIAMARERLNWFASFYVVATVGMIKM